MALSPVHATHPHPSGGVSCPRFPIGSTLVDSPCYFSSLHSLNVIFDYRHRVDAYGNDLFCYTDPSGHQSPTLRVSPGDFFTVMVINQLVPGKDVGGAAAAASSSAGSMMPKRPMLKPAAGGNGGITPCGDDSMDPSSVNLHFHGLGISPSCHKVSTQHC